MIEIFRVPSVALLNYVTSILRNAQNLKSMSRYNVDEEMADITLT